MEVVNPATGDRLDVFEDDTWADVDDALSRAAGAFADWSARPVGERERLLADAAVVLRENTREYAEVVTTEMGKPIAQAEAEIEKCAWACDHYAESASAYLEGDGHPSPPGATVRTVYEPIGPVLAVMPWNFPFWQVFRFAAPSLTAGNVGLLKHASNVPGCALAIEAVFREAGYPDGVFQSLLIGSDVVDDVIEDDRIRAVTITGSTDAGRAVGSAAGEGVKPSVLELGGSDPFVVLDDADVEAAAATGTWSRNQNAGQSCIAAKRFVVHTAVSDEFTRRLVDAVEGLAVGDPMDASTDVGPQARQSHVAALHDKVAASVEAGATVLTGGEPLDREGAYYPPTVLVDVPEGCPVDREEVFGPVAAVYEVDDEAQAVEKANDTPFGLGASVWTAPERGERIAAEIDAGCVYVNELVKSDPRVPFGGIKDSGYGRELAADGIRAFTNRKTVWVQQPTTPDGAPTE